MVNLECQNSMYALHSHEFQGLTAEGFLQDAANNEPIPHDQYCLDVFYNTTEWNETLIPLLCFPKTSMEQEYSTIRWVYFLQTLYLYRVEDLLEVDFLGNETSSGETFLCTFNLFLLEINSHCSLRHDLEWILDKR